MNQWRGISALAMAGLIGLGLGCDQQSPVAEPPPETAQVDPAAAPPTRPTTQALLEGSRKTLPLQLIPFSVDVPENWKIVVYDHREMPSVSMLEGPIINDEARVTLGLREAVSGEIVRLWIEKARKEDAEFRKLGGSVRTRDVGDLRIIDRRRPPSTGTTQPTDIPMEWRITLLYPSGIKYDQYELKFIGLSVESFKQNQALLNSIVESIKYDDTGTPPLPPRL